MTNRFGENAHLAAGELIEDVVVAGSGAAGLSAAVAALAVGASVVVLECAPLPGGTTARSGGYVWVPNNSLLRRRGLVDPKPDALRYMAKASFPDTYHAEEPRFGITEEQYQMLETFYDRGPDVIDRLEALGALQPTLEFAEGGEVYNTNDWLDYYEYWPEDKLRVGRNFRTKHHATNPPDDWPRKGSRGGWDLVQTMVNGLEGNGGRILLNHRVSAVLLAESGAVVGVRAETPAGSSVNIWARKAVIFATGGFTHDTELRKRLLIGPTYGGCAPPEARGDFLKIGWAIGAGTANLDGAWLQQVPFERSFHDPSNANQIFYPPGDSMILVDRNGRRVVNERQVYHDRTRVHFVWDAERKEFPNRVLFFVYDQRNADCFAGLVPIPPKGVSDGAVLAGQTVDELAIKVRERLESLAEETSGLRLSGDFGNNLKETIARFNRYAVHGMDPDFHRGGRLIDIQNVVPPPDNTKNPVLWPLSDTGPYYCVLIGAGCLDTNGGPRINEKSQVLDAQGAPIAGLYGAGNCIASPSAVAYWAGGCTLGLAMTFGFIAGENAAQERDRLGSATGIHVVEGAREPSPTAAASSPG